MPSLPDDALLRFIARPDYAPMRLEDIAQALGADKRELRFLKKTLPRLLGSGQILRVKGDKLARPAQVHLVTGVVKFNAGGSAKVFPEVPEGETPPADFSAEPIYIHEEDTGVALHGDTVVVRPDAPGGGRPSRRDEGRTGRIIRILRRVSDLVPGTLRNERHIWYVLPDDPRFPRDILVPEPVKAGLTPVPRADDKVVVRLGEWTDRHLNPAGDIVEVLGRTHTPMAEYKAILRRYRLSPEFPPEVMREVEALPTRVPDSDTRGRVDFRDILTLTIDPDDAKDFDDALSVEFLPDNALRVGIHIADVSHYVRPGSALDRDAAERGNSTYLVGTVVPMLPHALSNGLCSLVEAEDRLTKAVILTFDKAGQITRTELANTVIRSRKRLTYKQAYGLMRLDDLDAIRALPAPPPHQTGSPGRALASLDDREIGELRHAVRALWRVAARLRARRFAKGALDLEMTETKIYCDAQGFAERAEIVDHDESHQLVEEYMLAANETVARSLREAGLPHLSRVHDEPDPEKLSELRQELLGQGIATGDLTKRTEVVKLLAHIRDLPGGLPLRIRFLRSLRQACYRAEADGHYGLAKEDYSHFTSPIRRYADLIEHRVFDDHLVRSRAPSAPATPPKRYAGADLARIAAHISMTERNSADAERDSVKVKILELFEREAAQKRKSAFEGAIIDMREAGFGVELAASQAYGMVRFSSLEDDFYALAPDRTAAVGRRTRNTYKLGDTVRVVVDRVDRFKRRIDFRIAPPEARVAGGAAAPRVVAPPIVAGPDAPPRGKVARTKDKPAETPRPNPAKTGKFTPPARPARTPETRDRGIPPAAAAKKPGRPGTNGKSGYIAPAPAPAKKAAPRGHWADAPVEPHHRGVPAAERTPAPARNPAPAPAAEARVGVISRGKRKK